jgi:hypothetical protein
MPRWVVVVGLVVSAVAAGALGGFILAIGRGCQSDGSGGTNCDVIAGVGIAFWVIAVLLLVTAIRVALRRSVSDRKYLMGSIMAVVILGVAFLSPSAVVTLGSVGLGALLMAVFAVWERDRFR